MDAIREGERIDVKQFADMPLDALRAMGIEDENALFIKSLSQYAVKVPDETTVMFARTKSLAVGTAWGVSALRTSGHGLNRALTESTMELVRANMAGSTYAIPYDRDVTGQNLQDIKDRIPARFSLGEAAPKLHYGQRSLINTLNNRDFQSGLGEDKISYLVVPGNHGASLAKITLTLGDEPSPSAVKIMQAAGINQAHGHTDVQIYGEKLDTLVRNVALLGVPLR